MTALAQHFTDEQLLELPPDHPHLGECASCAAALQEIHDLAATLTTDLAWDDEPVSEIPNLATLSSLRSIATQMDAEDADAERNVASLLALPRESWMPALAAHPQYRTPGFVRRLIAETDRLIDSKPAEVVELTALAVEVADNLDVTQWYGDTIPRLRGAAWRERAYALYYVGRHVEALAAADRAGEHLARVAVSEYDGARLMHVRALIFRALERYDDALVALKSAAATLGEFGDERRATVAAAFEAAVAYSTRDYRRALQLFQYLADYARATGDLHTLASAQQNVAACQRELKDFESALRSFGSAVALFEELGMEAERVRARWHVGRVLLAEAKYPEAASILCAVKDSYARLEILDKAAIVAIDLAEASLMQGRFLEVVEACHHAISFYQQSALPYSANAMTALGLLGEAARAGRATTADVKRTRTYLENLPREPKLLFAQLPG